MSKKFLPLAGIAAALAIVSYLLLSFVFPHKKEVVVDTSVKPEQIFSAQLDEAAAQPTASTAESSELGTAPGVAESAPADASASASEPAAAPSDAASATPAEAAPAETTPTEPAAIETAAAPTEAAPAEPATTSEPAPAAGTGGSGLSRDQLAKIVAEAAAKAAAETAKSIAEQATREAASR